MHKKRDCDREREREGGGEVEAVRHRETNRQRYIDR